MHPKLRGLISAPFTRSAIAAREAGIRSRIRQLLLPLLPLGEMDFAVDIAYPLSAAVIGELVGIPDTAYQQINEWAKAIVTAGYTEGGMEKAATAQQEMFHFFYGLLEIRGQKPETDPPAGGCPAATFRKSYCIRIAKPAHHFYCSTLRKVKTAVIRYPFPDAISPYAGQLETLTREWLYRDYPMLPEEIRRRYAATRTGYLTARFFPLASFERLQPLAMSSLWGLAFDDYYEHSSPQVFRRLKSRIGLFIRGIGAGTLPIRGATGPVVPPMLIPSGILPERGKVSDHARDSGGRLSRRLIASLRCSILIGFIK